MLIGIATLFILLFGGSGLEYYLTNLEDPVKEYVKDKAHQEVILDAGKELGKQLEDIKKDTDAEFDLFVKVHADYESTPANFNAITEKMLATQVKMSKQVLDARDKMHQAMTPEEWHAVFKEE